MTSGNENEHEIWNSESAELFQAGGEILLSEINELINSMLNKEEMP
jgi:hypothetical protein